MVFTRTTYDAVIVGAGPVGLLLGILLKRNGLHVVVVEKRPTRSKESKASAINSYSLAILSSIGVLDECLDNGLKVHELLLFWKQARIMKVDYRRLPSKNDFILCLSQPKLEEILERRYLDVGGELYRSIEAIEVVAREGDNVVKLSDGSSISTAYVLGCDGSKSSIRREFAIPFEGEDLPVNLIMCDCKFDVPDSFERGKVHYHVDDNNFAVIIPFEEGFHRIYIKRRARDEGDHALSREYFQSLLDAYGLGQICLNEVTWTSKVGFYHRVAAQFRKDRTFLCGDAAHVFPPLGGLGMNTGFQDALGLAWRLTGVVQGQYAEAILADYDQERRQIVTQLIERTVGTARLIARLDQDDQSAVQQWRPTMENRGLIRSVLPLAYSGLAQRYGSASAATPVIGRLVPYFERVGIESSTPSFDFIDAAHFVIFTTSEAAPAAAEIAQRYPNVAVVELPDVAPAGPYWRSTGALLMRPDGIVVAEATDPNLAVIAESLLSVPFVQQRKANARSNSRHYSSGGRNTGAVASREA